MKKIDKLVLSSFIGPFILTFLVVVFILLMQNMLKYFDDIIGKDLGWDVLGQLLFFMAVFMTPVALPLAVLLSSLIAFGNLGEHFELSAIKSAGISLIRALQPIFIFVLILTGLAFYVNNNLVPKAALEAYSLLYDIKQKKPALDLRAGSFYMGIPDISIKVNQKFSDDDRALKGIVIYDHRKNDGNKEVIVADSGRMYTILNERYLKLELYNGYDYSEGGGGQDLGSQQNIDNNNTESLSRSKFSKTQVVFDLSSFQLSRTEKKWFQGNRIMRNLSELNKDIDSMQNEVLSQRLQYYSNRTAFFAYFKRTDSITFPPDLLKFKRKRDSLARSAYMSTKVDSARAVTIKPIDTVKLSSRRPSDVHKKEKFANLFKKNTAIFSKHPIKKDSQNATSLLQKKMAEQKPSINSAQSARNKLKADSIANHKIDSLSKLIPSREDYQNAANVARQAKDQLQNSNTNLMSYETEMRVFEIQWHKIMASSLACIAMFLIGAPLGAIIKKGGLGVPFLVSILFFIIYYVMNIVGEKWAKQGSVEIVYGVWGADIILFIVGLLFLRQARADARLFETDFYLVVFDKVKQWLKRRKMLPSSVS